MGWATWTRWSRSIRSSVACSSNTLPVALVEVQDVSHAVVYLASDESRYVTGTQFKVDAGTTNR